MEGLGALFKGGLFKGGGLKGAIPAVMGKDKFKDIATKPAGALSAAGRKQMKGAFGGAVSRGESLAEGMKSNVGG